jgi:hypothetical protein
VSNLLTMRTRIRSELRRGSDLTDATIDAAIATAIGELEAERFLFNETREINFPTVAQQAVYTSADSAFIPRIRKFDFAFVYLSDQPYRLAQEAQEKIEYWSMNGNNTGQPNCFAFYNERITLYPTPPDVYTIRFGAVVNMPAPAADDEADNPWMTDAEKLVRMYAKHELYQNVLLDMEKAAIFNPDNDMGPTGQAKRALKAKTNNLTQIGGWVTTPTPF